MIIIKTLSLVFLAAALAGCGSGGGSGLFSASGDVFSAGLSSSEGSSGADSISSGLVESTATGTQVALVHNPEPATMLLWGAGLAAAALAKRRRK